MPEVGVFCRNVHEIFRNLRNFKFAKLGEKRVGWSEKRTAENKSNKEDRDPRKMVSYGTKSALR